MKQFLKAYFVVIFLGFVVRVLVADDILLYLPISFVILTMAYFRIDFEPRLKIFLLSISTLLSSVLAWPFLSIEKFQVLIFISVFESLFLMMIWLQVLYVVEDYFKSSGDK